ncbi:MAG: hypothetical protein MJZ57_02325 [Bacteroidales bacterium]|nr:hypothetical protein [Bacteroidales bacterium]
MKLSTFFCNLIFFLFSVVATNGWAVPLPADSLHRPLMATIDSTKHLYFYKPDNYHLDIVCGERPDTLDENVLFCAEAAFTGKIVDSFYYKNIAGDFVTSGELHHGYECKANSGGFIFYKDGHWAFFPKETYHKKLKDTTVYCAYEQALVIINGVVYHPYIMKPERRETYRALCETQDGELMVVTAKEDIAYEKFVQALVSELDVRNALYMDMGIGWNYSWYRNEDSTFTSYFPMAKWTQYQTNWLVFRR